MLGRSGRYSSNSAITLVALLVLTSLSPMAFADDDAEDQNYRIVGDLDDFDPATDGKQYLFSTSPVPIYSATGFLKSQWRSEGYPDLVLPFSQSYLNSRGLARNCDNAWSVGDTGDISTAGGTISATVQKISSNSAIIVEDGQVIPSTTLNDIASTWESTIFPTVTSYFGTSPDVDNNCQVEIVIFSIDGAGGIGGYFVPGLSSSTDSLFVDIDDLSWRNTIIAHEFQHLLHNARDPFEFIWIDEGAADMASYLCFGVTNTLTGHANEWSQNSNMSVRWWNQRIADYGAGFLFMMYLSDKLGGASSISSLVANTDTGGSAIEYLASNPPPGSTPIGTTMSDIFANFTLAVSIDSDQGAFGFSNLDLSAGCISAFICKAQMSGFNDQWVNPWTSPLQELEGWGMRAYKFNQGSGAPLNIMVQPSEFGFEGALLAKDSSTGSWSMSRMRVDQVTGSITGLIHGFGTDVDEVWMTTWYESTVDDCDYNYATCGITSGSYPTATVTVQAMLVTDPAEVSIDSIEGFDRDEDGLSDSVQIDLDIVSNSFFEILEVTVDAFSNNTLVDTKVFSVSAGNSIATEKSVWFTPPYSSEWTFGIDIRDVTSSLVDQAFSLPLQLANMEPVASISVSVNSTQTWLPVNMFGSGYDEWGFGMENGSFSNNETPIAYFWDLGDNVSSTLKNPVHQYLEPGTYPIVLTVMDQGGYYSEAQTWNVIVEDTSDPIPEISVEGVVVSEELILMTNQQVMFSALGTTDNLPLEELYFEWNWGDGEIESGIGLYESSHSWVDGSSDGIIYTLSLLVSDGIHDVEHTIFIRILNRVPQQIFDSQLQTYTLTPLELPVVFTDSDGMIVSYDWTFEEGVNLDGGGMTMTSDFSHFSSDLANPVVGWLTPGLKNIGLTVIDDDGNSTSATIQVNVINQRPVAVFSRPGDGTVDTTYTFTSYSFDPDGDSTQLSTIWSISDLPETIENTTSVSHTFMEPGLYTVSLIVIDVLGLSSAEKSFSLRIENPLPVPMIDFSCPNVNGSILKREPTDSEQVIWQVPQTESGDVFVSPMSFIKFDGSRSYDSDPAFVGKSSMDSEDVDWNGITRWIWDFGDASPQVEGGIAWHQYTIPGSYTVTLTVVDGFEGGETNSTSIDVVVSESPVILTDSPISSDYVNVGDSVYLNYSVYDQDLEDGLVAWIDSDTTIDSDGDGDFTNDMDDSLSDDLVVRWDLDASVDSDGDGDYKNDWDWNPETWSEEGEIKITMQVCDAVNVCAERDYVITVLSTEDEYVPKSLADLTWEDIVPNRESGGLLALVGLVLLLGWIIMRQKDEEELEAEDMMETYDVDEVESDGGLPGMDQHKPPPQPKYLSEEERRDADSGYVRPIRTRRR